MLRNLVLALALSSSAALAQDHCDPGSIMSEASCGGDYCDCASPCSVNNDCAEGCCVDGYCTRACVCRGEGSVLYDCVPGYGCGSVAPTSRPLGLPALWLLALSAAGLAFAAASARRRGWTSPAVVVALSVSLLGAAVLGAGAVERGAAVSAKGRAR